MSDQSRKVVRILMGLLFAVIGVVGIGLFGLMAVAGAGHHGQPPDLSPVVGIFFFGGAAFVVSVCIFISRPWALWSGVLLCISAIVFAIAKFDFCGGSGAVFALACLFIQLESIGQLDSDTDQTQNADVS